LPKPKCVNADYAHLDVLVGPAGDFYYDNTPVELAIDAL
jgi:hypothetical protein